MRTPASLILAAVVALAFSPADAQSRSTVGVTHTHASTNMHYPRATLTRLVTRLAAGRGIITWTEVGQRARARALPRNRHGEPGWHTYTPAGTDTATSWRRPWHRRAAGVHVIGPDHLAGLVVLDRPGGPRVLVATAHLPAHVEYGDHWRPGVAGLVDTWQTSRNGLARRIAIARHRWRPGLVLVVADWNVDVRRPAWRPRVRFGGLSLTWRRRALPDAGTHGGGRLIDATLTDGRGHARLLRGTAASDHRPYRERLVSP